jgi:16S rRNA (cytosine967-C5)-methyltransferase
VSGEPRGPSRRTPGARELAAKVLLRVYRQGAFAAAALDAELERLPDLDPRERGLTTELVYGVLRTRGALEQSLSKFVSRKQTDEEVELQLLLGAYQLLLLDRVPAFAAVDAAVTSVRAKRGPKVAGFVNAVLRRMASQAPKLTAREAALASAPSWLREGLESAVGREEADELLTGEHELTVRVLPGRAPHAWLDEAPAGRLSPRARRISHGDPRKLPGYAEGAFLVQEEGAQAVALALGVRPGDKVLDACAGRGQKTSLLREQAGADAELWASDLYPEKLRLLAQDHARLGLRPPETCAVDFSVGTGALPADFDRVLVDSPCTGVGTLRRRPEIMLRLTPEDPARLGALAETILRRATTRAKPGGRVVFAVCSVLREECEDVVERVADILEPAPFDAPELAPCLPEGATSVRFLPRAHGTDGYFIASFRRRG